MTGHRYSRSGDDWWMHGECEDKMLPLVRTSTQQWAPTVDLRPPLPHQTPMFHRILSNQLVGGYRDGGPFRGHCNDVLSSISGSVCTLGWGGATGSCSSYGHSGWADGTIPRAWRMGIHGRSCFGLDDHVPDPDPIETAIILALPVTESDMYFQFSFRIRSGSIFLLILIRTSINLSHIGFHD